jgi:hypothetical protein
MSNPSRHSSSRSNRYAPLEEIVLPTPLPITPAPAPPPPFFAAPAPKTEAETADVFGSHDPWADVQATPTPRRMRPSTRHASRAPMPFVPEPLDSAYHWNNQTYATLEDVVIASSCTFGVSDNLSQWLNVVIREFTCCDVVVGYNALGVLVSTPPFIIFALFFGLCIRRARSDFLIVAALPAAHNQTLY